MVKGSEPCEIVWIDSSQVSSAFCRVHECTLSDHTSGICRIHDMTRKLEHWIRAKYSYATPSAGECVLCLSEYAYVHPGGLTYCSACRCSDCFELW